MELNRINNQQEQNPIKGKIFLHPDEDIRFYYKLFKNSFFRIYKEQFIETEESKYFIYTLLYFFTRKNNFYNSPLLYKYPNTEYNVNKNLFIIGDVGCGKTSSLKTLQSIININPNLNLKYTTTKDAVRTLEVTVQENLYDFYENLNNGHLIIDDLTLENVGSRFGKIDLFKEVLYKRSENDKMTSIITTNYIEDYPYKIDKLLETIRIRYGKACLDRIIGDYNFILLKGETFRNNTKHLKANK